MPDAWPTAPQVAFLVAGGAAAGFVNALAGGGSFLTVPLLVLAGLPPTVANGTNRVAVWVQCLASVVGFRQEGASGVREALRFLPAVALGSWLGAHFAARAPEALFARIFGAAMLLALPVLLRQPTSVARRRRGEALQQGIYLAIGLWGGALQAGVGIPLTLALAGAGGLDLVRANAAKAFITLVLTSVALASFVWAGKVVWSHGLVLAAGTALGGYVGARLGGRIGERLIRPVLAAAVIALALHLLLAAG